MRFHNIAAFFGAVAFSALMIVFSDAEAQGVPSIQTLPDNAKPRGACGDYARRDKSYYDPRRDKPAPSQGYHRSIECAIDRAKNKDQGGAVIVHRKRGAYLTPSFRVLRQNMHIKAGDRSVTIGHREDGACVIIDPRGEDAYNSTTVLEGFTFKAKSDAMEPCINVRRGKLVLINSRIEMPTNGRTGIYVSADAKLEFKPGDTARHGIFWYDKEVPGEPTATGIFAEFDVESLVVNGVQLRGLKRAIASQANHTVLANVRFSDNEVGVDIQDTAGSPYVAPKLTIAGGEFINHIEAVRLSGDPDAPTWNESIGGDGGRFYLPNFDGFDGAIVIGSKEGEALSNLLGASINDIKDETVKFVNNRRGIHFVDTHPTAGLHIADAEFIAHSDFALNLRLPEDVSEGQQFPGNLNAHALISNTLFKYNARSIKLEGGFRGKLKFGDGVKFEKDDETAPSTVNEFRLHGVGTFEADKIRIADAHRPIQFGSGWEGEYNIKFTNSKNARMAIVVSSTHELCMLNARNENDRAHFARFFSGKKRSIHIAGKVFGSDITNTNLSTSSNPWTRREMKKMQERLCMAGIN